MPIDRSTAEQSMLLTQNNYAPIETFVAPLAAATAG